MNFLQNLTIKRRLQLNALVVGLAMIVMLCIIIYEARIMLKLNETIQYAEELDIHELSMRKYEKDFLFYKDESSLDLFTKEYKQLQLKLEKLTVLSTDLNIATAQVSQFSALAKQYYDDFQVVVKLQRKIGLHPKDALYGELREAVHSIETLLNEQNNYQLLTTMLQLRRAEKDFMLRLDTKYLDRFNKLAVELKQQVSAADLPNQTRSQLASLMSNYQGKFTALVEAQVALGVDLNSGALGKMRISVKKSDEVVSYITAATKEQVSETANQAQLLAIVIFVIASVIVMALVYLTSRSIIQPIERVYQAIDEIRRNNDLSLFIEHKGKDEVTRMTIDFNSLIGDFKKLIYEVNTALKTLNIATEDLSNTTAATSSGMQEQLHEADMVATAATEMQATIQDISHNTEAAAKKAESTNESALQGQVEVESTIKHINALSDSLVNASGVVSQLEKDGETIG